MKKCFEGVLVKNHTTPLGHRYIALKDTKIHKEKDGIIVKSIVKDMPIMAFVVPKRRERVFNQMSQIEIGTNIVIEVLQESRSSKWTVSEVEVLK